MVCSENDEECLKLICPVGYRLDREIDRCLLKDGMTHYYRINQDDPQDDPVYSLGYECCPEGHHVCSQSEYARCYDARNMTWIADLETEPDTKEDDSGDICCLRKNVMSAGIVMSGYKVLLSIQNINSKYGGGLTILIHRKIVMQTLSGLTGEENA